MVFYCCVPCKNTNNQAHMYRFPIKDLLVFSHWLNRVGNKTLIGMDKAQLYKNYMVCEEHFHESCIIASSKRCLKLGSMPIHNLPGNCMFDVEDARIVPLCKSSTSGTMVDDEFGPSTSAACSTLETRPTCEINIDDSASAGMASATIIRSMTPVASCTKTNVSTPRKRSTFRKRINLLKLINSTRATQLSPKANKLYRVAKNLRKFSNALEQENRLLKEQSVSQTTTFAKEYLQSVVNEATANFIISQMTQQQKKAKGRRFSFDDKLLALTLYKQSPKGYRLLRKIFALPAKSTLNKILSAIHFQCGVNENMLNILKMSISQMKEADKIAVLMFDEIALEPALAYSNSLDQIVGFEDLGLGRSQKIADKALVFMIKGIYKNWKQPIAYYFVDDSLKGVGLAIKIKEIISALQGIGVQILATVCDQATTNCAAINYLIEDTYIHLKQQQRNNIYCGFFVNAEEIIPLFDAPHLLKGIRNNLLTKNASFKWKRDMEVASWNHIEAFYLLDQAEVDLKMCYKLTDLHIYSNKMKKMKVNLAAQVFSHSVSAIMRKFAEVGMGGICKEAVGTADFLLFFDKLFDSFNGSSFEAIHGKTLRTAISSKSQHEDFWKEALGVLQSIKFIKDKTSTVPPSLSNWIKNIKRLTALWHKLNKMGHTYLKPRSVNQDPLENFFGQIRSHGVRYNNPSCYSFISSYKTLILNDFSTVHSPGANCEYDPNTALSKLHDLLQKKSTVAEHSLEICSTLPIPNIDPNVSRTSNCVIQYVGGFVLKKMLKFLKCRNCKADLLSGNNPDCFMIKAKQYHQKALITPGSKIGKYFSIFFCLLNKYLEKHCTEDNIQENLIKHLNRYPIKLGCSEHQENAKNIFFKFCAYYHMHIWIKNINKTLKGKDENANKAKYNKIRLVAHSKFIKYRKRQLKIKKMKNL